MSINHCSLNEKCVWTHEDEVLNYLLRSDVTWNLRHTQLHHKTGSFSRCFCGLGGWWHGLKKHKWGPLPFGSYFLLTFPAPKCPKMQPHPSTHRFPDISCFAHTVPSPWMSLFTYTLQTLMSSKSQPKCSLLSEYSLPSPVRISSCLLCMFG